MDKQIKFTEIRKQFSNNGEESDLPSVFMCLNPEGFDAGAIVVDGVDGVMQELGNL